jgi:hypothetical protein
LRQAYDYWQDQPGNYVGRRARTIVPSRRLSLGNRPNAERDRSRVVQLALPNLLSATRISRRGNRTVETEFSRTPLFLCASRTPVAGSEYTRRSSSYSSYTRPIHCPSGTRSLCHSNRRGTFLTGHASNESGVSRPGTCDVVTARKHAENRPAPFADAYSDDFVRRPIRACSHI